MTSDIQREAIALLAEVWTLSPDVRLGQLLSHLGFLGEAHLGHGLGDIEDDEIMAILERHKAELTARLHGLSTHGVHSAALPLATTTAVMEGNEPSPSQP